VVLRPQRLLTRCVMVDVAQDDLPAHGRILKTVTDHHAMMFGLWATVERVGHITVGDDVVVGDGFPTHAPPLPVRAATLTPCDTPSRSG
jgi:hypothetical protein